MCPSWSGGGRSEVLHLGGRGSFSGRRRNLAGDSCPTSQLWQIQRQTQHQSITGDRVRHYISSCPKCNFDYRGWMVVLASFLCVAIVDGVGYTTGLMLERLLSELTLERSVLLRSIVFTFFFSLKSELGGSRGAVAVVGSLQVFFAENSRWGKCSNSSSGWCLLVERSNCWEARQQIWPQGGLHLWGNCCQVWAIFDWKIWLSNSQLWPSCLVVRTLPHYGLLKLWPHHRLWVWSNVSFVNTQRNLRIDSLIFWLCRYLPSVVGVAPFFTENRALAIGICLCGSGVGRKTFPSAILNSSSQGWHFWPCPRVKFYSSQVSWLVIIHHCIVDFFLYLQTRLALGDADVFRPLSSLHVLWGSHGHRLTSTTIYFSWHWRTQKRDELNHMGRVQLVNFSYGLCLLCTLCEALMARGWQTQKRDELNQLERVELVNFSSCLCILCTFCGALMATGWLQQLLFILDHVSVESFHGIGKHKKGWVEYVIFLTFNLFEGHFD